MTPDERIDNLTQNMELLSGMMRDLIAKVDALADVSSKHEAHINDAIDILLGHDRRIAKLEGKQ